MSLQIPKLNNDQKYGTPYLQSILSELNKIDILGSDDHPSFRIGQNHDRYTALGYALLYQNEWRRKDNVENTQTQ